MGSDFADGSTGTRLEKRSLTGEGRKLRRDRLRVHRPFIVQQDMDMHSYHGAHSR